MVTDRPVQNDDERPCVWQTSEMTVSYSTVHACATVQNDGKLCIIHRLFCDDFDKRINYTRGRSRLEGLRTTHYFALMRPLVTNEVFGTSLKYQFLIMTEMSVTMLRHFVAHSALWGQRSRKLLRHQTIIFIEIYAMTMSYLTADACANAGIDRNVS